MSATAQVGHATAVRRTATGSCGRSWCCVLGAVCLSGCHAEEERLFLIFLFVLHAVLVLCVAFWFAGGSDEGYPGGFFKSNLLSGLRG